MKILILLSIFNPITPLVLYIIFNAIKRKCFCEYNLIKSSFFIGGIKNDVTNCYMSETYKCKKCGHILEQIN